MVTRIETKPGPWNITDPDWPTYDPYIPNAIVTSDSFSTASPDIVGRMTDVALGGYSRAWQGSTEAYVSTGGRLVQSGAAKAGFVGFVATSTAQEIVVRVSALPTANHLQLHARRINDDNLFRLLISPTGGISVQSRISGSNTTVGSGWGLVATTDTISLRTVGTNLSVFVNSISRGTAAIAAPSAPGMIGIGHVASTGGAAVDDVAIWAR